MSLEDLVAAAGLAGVILYGVLGGADFGGGIWDLFAGGPRRDEQRKAIARAMGPVWEANHVWLIFVIVVLFTAFPPAFAALSIGLFGLFHFVLIGIILRGAAFVFRGSEVSRYTAYWGSMFGVASVITPALLGMAVGAVSSGDLRVIDGQVQIAGQTPWLSPISLIIGALALALCAFLAAVYLTNETLGELREDFRRRAIQSGVVVVALAVVAMPVLYLDAPHLWHGLLEKRTVPIIFLNAIAAIVTGMALWRRQFRIARLASVSVVSLLLLGWGLAQFPYLIFPDVTLSDSAAPDATLRFVLYSIPFGGAILIPSLWLLFRIFKSDNGKRESA